MRLQDELRRARGLFLGLTFYEAFEHAVVLVLTLLIVLIVLSATWHLALAVFALIVANQIDPANQEVFQAGPCCTEAGYDATWAQCAQPGLLFKRYGHS